MKRDLGNLENLLINTKPKAKNKKAPKFCIDGYEPSLKMLGHSVPELREIYKNFYFKESNDVIKILNYLWDNATFYETRSVVLEYFSDKKNKDDLLKFWPSLKKYVKTIDNWAHSDYISSLIAKLNEEYPEKIFPELLKWNSSKNPWIVRQSMVSLLYYSLQRKTYLPFNKMIPLVENHIFHDYYYVQKGVGWTIRELYNIYPKETLNFIKKNAKDISSIAYVAATEKLDIKDKLAVQSLRKF